MNEKNTRLLIILLVGTVLLVFMLRFLVAFRFVFFAVLAIGGLGFGIYWLVNYLRNRKKEKAFSKTTEGRMVKRLEECHYLLEENRAEMKEIKDNIRELEAEQRKYDQKLARKNWKDIQELIGGFKAELELRETKMLFYRQCIQKLEQMLENHRLGRALEEKKEKLQSLQDEHYESLAKLEELKSDVEMDVFYLDTIENLSQRMLTSSTLDDTLQLKKELEEMTRELE